MRHAIRGSQTRSCGTGSRFAASGSKVYSRQVGTDGVQPALSSNGVPEAHLVIGSPIDRSQLPRTGASTSALSRFAGLSARIVLALAAAFVAPAAGQQVPNGPTRSALAGVVRDSAGRPIERAEVIVDDDAARAVTDGAGRFFVGPIATGITGFTVRRIGYEVASFTIRLAPDTTLEVAITLKSFQLLDPVRVEAEPISPRLVRFGFLERQRTTIGSFVSPQRVDSLWYLMSPAQMLRDVRGIDVRCIAGSRCRVRPRMPPDCLWLFIDGAFVDAELDDVLTTGAVYAFEVYERPSIVPSEFQARLPQKRGGGLTVKAGCGALVVWTRTRAGR